MPSPHPPRRIAALIVAAGRGVRAGGGLPKQYRMIGGRAVLARSAALFLTHPRVEHVAVVIHPDDEALYREAVAGLEGLLPPVMGGATRQASVLAGLEALAAQAPDAVLIHDAVRPFASEELVTRVIDALATNRAVLAGHRYAEARRCRGVRRRHGVA